MVTCMAKWGLWFLIVFLAGCMPVEPQEYTISRARYADGLEGFWLGQSIANWTGLVTEMDKIGTGAFYTRDDWGALDQPSIWGEGVPSDLSATIDFVFREPGDVWGADDDTDIEYMYQYLMAQHGTARLSPEQIRDGWLTHIHRTRQNFSGNGIDTFPDMARTGISIVDRVVVEEMGGRVDTTRSMWIIPGVD